MRLTWLLKRLILHITRDGLVGLAAGLLINFLPTTESYVILFIILYIMTIVIKEIKLDPHPSDYFWWKSMLDIGGSIFFVFLFLMLLLYYI